MRIFALSAGIEAPTGQFSGIVHSVFDRACNIRLETAALMTLVSSGTGNVPNGLRLKTPPWFAFSDFIRAGTTAACRGGILRFDGSDLSIALRNATCWHIDLSGLRIDLRRRNHAEAWTTAWHELCAHRHGDAISPFIGTVDRDKRTHAAPVEPACRTVPALLDATGDLQVTKACAAIEPLIGLGPGLTPSGDDFLVGYLAGLWSAAGNNLSRLRFLTSMGAWLSEAASGSNIISQTSIESAIRGNVSEPIAALAQQLAQTDCIERIRAATRTALHVGHSSGPAGTAGLLFGCAAWAGPSLPPIVRRPPFVLDSVYNVVFKLQPWVCRAAMPQGPHSLDDVRRHPG